MSHDDRIRQLTGLFLEDLRAPMEASFNQLLQQLMAIAAGDQSAAVQEALTRAQAEHQAALDDAHAGAARDRDAALDALRADLASDRETALDALRAELTRDHELALDALRAVLTREHEAGLDALRTELAARHEEAVSAERAERDRQHQETLDAVNAELAVRHNQALEALRTETAAEHDAAIEELVRNREESLEALRRQADVERDLAVQAAREELGREHEAAVAALREQLQREHEEAVARERESWAGEHETAVGDARASAEATAAVAFAAVEHERDAARASVAELTDQLAAARAQHEQLTQLAHAEAEAAAEMAQGVAVDTHVAERQSEMACSERVLAATRALDEARSLSEVLTALADHAASNAVRVAVLLVNGTRMRGWRLAGMGDVQAGSVDLPVAQAGVIGRAVELGTGVSNSDAGLGDDSGLPSFLATPAGRVGLALPVLVGGRVVAVLYADDGGSGTPVVPSNWPELTEVLTRHAARCLEVLTFSRTTAAARPMQEWQAKVRETEEQEEESARRHARLLISEIKLYNQELVERGRRDGNLLGLLGPEIERARRLYEEKIPAAVRLRVDCFDEEIVRTLAGGDRTLLGQVT